MKTIPLRPLIHVEQQEQDYEVRPGAYGLILDEEQRLLCIEETRGLFLPGGGQESGENLQQSLQRELSEELQAGLISSTYLIAADECRYSPVYQQHFHIQSHYFLAQLESTSQLVPEARCKLHWLQLDEAARNLMRHNDRWLCSLLQPKAEFGLQVPGIQQDIKPEEWHRPGSGSIFWQQSLKSSSPEIELIIRQNEDVVGWIRLATLQTEYEVRGLFLSTIRQARIMMDYLNVYFPGINIADPGQLINS